MGHLVGVGCEKVVVAHGPHLREGDEGDESESAHGGGKAVGDTRQQGVDQEGDPEGDGCIGRHENPQAHSEAGKEKRVQVGRERTIEVEQVAIQPGTLGDSPGDVEFPAEIDQGVGAVVPTPPQDDGSHDQDEGRSGVGAQRFRAAGGAGSWSRAEGRSMYSGHRLALAARVTRHPTPWQADSAVEAGSARLWVSMTMPEGRE